MRNLGLDIVRFIAILLVLGNHLELPETNHWIFQAWRTGGWTGVDLFFVISGYLISSLLFEEFKLTGTVDLKRFLIRRGFKIYPPFWLLTLISVLIFRATGQTRTTTQLIVELLFIQNYFPGVWLYTWSLAVEEHFYLGLATLFRALKFFNISRSIRFVPAVCLWVCLSVFYLRWKQVYSSPVYFFFMHAFSTHLRIDSLCFGVLISYLVCFHNLSAKLDKISALIPILLGTFLLLPAFIYPRETHSWILVWGLTIFYLGSGLIVLGALKLKSSTHQLLKMIGNLGSASYSIYLWHVPVKIWFLPAVTKRFQISNPEFEFGLYFLSSFIIGWVMHRLVEKPVLQLRDYFYKTSPSPLDSPSHLELSLRTDLR